jgi:hypothetical protein
LYALVLGPSKKWVGNSENIMVMTLIYVFASQLVTPFKLKSYAWMYQLWCATRY